MPPVDLNSDLGESFGAWRMGDDEAMLDLVSSANLACGFHAGDPLTMLTACRAAAERGVVIGAHPAYRDLVGFGRRDMTIAPDALRADLLYQVSALAGMAQHAGTAVRYLKPHGALYNRAAVDPATAAVVAEVGAELSLPVLGLPGSEVEAACAAVGSRFVAEAFADRAYQPDGRLVPRTQAGAVLHDPDAIADRVLGMVGSGRVAAADGTLIPIEVESVCVHGDSPGAVAIAESVRHRLLTEGVTVAAFV